MALSIETYDAEMLTLMAALNKRFKCLRDKLPQAYRKSHHDDKVRNVIMKSNYAQR